MDCFYKYQRSHVAQEIFGRIRDNCGRFALLNLPCLWLNFNFLLWTSQWIVDCGYKGHRVDCR